MSTRRFRWTSSSVRLTTCNGVSPRAILSSPRSQVRARFFMKRTTRGWVRKAEGDFRLAVAIARGDEPFHDEQCFHCQQSAEKYLKALLEELGHTVPKTHNLVAVLRLVAPHHAALRSLRRGLDF